MCSATGSSSSSSSPASCARRLSPARLARRVRLRHSSVGVARVAASGVSRSTPPRSVLPPPPRRADPGRPVRISGTVQSAVLPDQPAARQDQPHVKISRPHVGIGHRPPGRRDRVAPTVPLASWVRIIRQMPRRAPPATLGAPVPSSTWRQSRNASRHSTNSQPSWPGLTTRSGFSSRSVSFDSAI